MKLGKRKRMWMKKERKRSIIDKEKEEKRK